jgi:anti-anti-sigma factor
MPSAISSSADRDFRISVEGDNTELVLRLFGDFDTAAAPSVLAAVEAAASLDSCQHLVFELSGVCFLDSAGIGVLVRAAMLQQFSGGSISVRNGTEPVLRLLALMRLTALIPLEHTG